MGGRARGGGGGDRVRVGLDSSILVIPIQLCLMVSCMKYIFFNFNINDKVYVHSSLGPELQIKNNTTRRTVYESYSEYCNIYYTSIKQITSVFF